MSHVSVSKTVFDILKIDAEGPVPVFSPINGVKLGAVRWDNSLDVEAKISASTDAFQRWREIPAPRRGELVRLFAEELRANKAELAQLITLEVGKIPQESLGEVQEMIDICDYAVGLSRQLCGATIASERPGHRMSETWHPLGPVGIISAFNFPVAVWSWNAVLALVCGNSVIWKPSEKSSLCALATQNLLARAINRFGQAPKGLSAVLLGPASVGAALAADRRISLISATGSTQMGSKVALAVSGRLGRSILELGGNNAMIIRPTANLEMALRGIVFSALGTAGQRCTSLRRLFVHGDIYDELMARLERAFLSIQIGDPRQEGILVGPLIDCAAYESMQRALDAARSQGGIVIGGERVLAERWPNAYYVKPAIVKMPCQTEIVRTETFAPILYAMKVDDFDAALKLHNDVPQGLSSCIFTDSLHEAERFLATSGSDCGIANVNIGPSGAEIGGAFGGEKETGGGRESGSDSWKAYMRRQTATVNYSDDLPLAQGIVFEAS